MVPTLLRGVAQQPSAAYASPRGRVHGQPHELAAVGSASRTTGSSAPRAACGGDASTRNIPPLGVGSASRNRRRLKRRPTERGPRLSHPRCAPTHPPQAGPDAFAGGPRNLGLGAGAPSPRKHEPAPGPRQPCARGCGGTEWERGLPSLLQNRRGEEGGRARSRFEPNRAQTATEEAVPRRSIFPAILLCPASHIHHGGPFCRQSRAK